MSKRGPTLGSAPDMVLFRLRRMARMTANLTIRRVFLIWTAFSWLNLSPVAARSQSFEDVARRAHSSRESNRLKQAINLYERALELNPSWSEGWWHLGALSYELDRYEAARRAFRRFLELDEQAGSAWALLGLCEYHLQHYDHSLDSLSTARTLGLGGNEELRFAARFHQALLLNRERRFDESFLLLFDLAYEYPQKASVIEALGISGLRLPYLPSEVPEDRHEMVKLAGQSLGHLASFRLDAAREAYRQLLDRFPEAEEVRSADPDLLLEAGPPDGFPIDAASEIVSSDQASLGDSDLVIGVVINAQPRAYPVNYMNGPLQEVVNDTLGGRAIAATW